MRALKSRVWDSFAKKFKYGRRLVDHYTNCEPCTGLKDKNGKEIYVGDIVKQTCSNLVYSVRFENGGFLPFTSDMMTFDNDYCEVIGNIHENPELLKGK